jgi:hypothetical protein
LVQQCANLWIVCGNQGKIGLFLVCCHTGLLKESAITRRLQRHDTIGESVCAVCTPEDCDKRMYSVSE